MEKNEFYTVKEIMNQTGYCKSKCYELINSLNENLKEKNPNILILKGRILKKYWDSQFIMNMEENTNEI